MITSRDVEQFFTCILLGPLLGSLCAILWLLLGEFFSEPLSLHHIVELLYAVFVVTPGVVFMTAPFAYVIGIVPAAMGAVLASIFLRFIFRKAGRILAAPIFGLIAFDVCLALVACLGPAEIEWSFYWEWPLVTSAPAALICALLVEKFASPFPEKTLRVCAENCSNG